MSKHILKQWKFPEEAIEAGGRPIERRRFSMHKQNDEKRGRDRFLARNG